MWRSPSSRRLLRAFLPGAATPAAHRVAEHPIRRPLLFPLFLSSSSAVPPPSASPGSGASAVDGPDGAAAEPISFAEAKRLVNVESLKRKLGKDGDEVIGYGELLDACEGMGVARSREEAAAFARVLDDAGVVLLFRDKVYLHPDKVVNLVRKAVPLALAPENDPGREELKQLQKKKEEIDMLAHRQVRRILWSGLGFFVVQLGVVCCRNYATSSSNTVSWPLSDSRNVKDIRPQTKPSEYKKSGDGEHLNGDGILEKPIGKNISSVEKRKFLVNTLLDLKESKEAVHGTLDAWVAWEHEFPLASLKKALLVLEKHEQWHRIVQVIKWMLSKGQGKTMGTYEQLIRALEKDNRVEEAHRIWMNKINYDLHSVPWRFCDLMISIYYRNNMLERLLELFLKLESFDRKPPSKRIVQKAGDAYEVLGLLEEKNKLMEKYSDLFSEPSAVRSKKSRKREKSSAKNGNEAGKKTCKDTEASACMEEESGMSDEEANIAL